MYVCLCLCVYDICLCVGICAYGLCYVCMLYMYVMYVCMYVCMWVYVDVYVMVRDMYIENKNKIKIK